MEVMGISAPPGISSVRAIHLNQDVREQMEHLIISHTPDPLCQPNGACQYSANVKQLRKPGGKERPSERESDKCCKRPCTTHTKQDRFYLSMVDKCRFCCLMSFCPIHRHFSLVSLCLSVLLSVLLSLFQPNPKPYVALDLPKVYLERKSFLSSWVLL